MIEKLSIELSEIQQIIESDWDDKAIRLRVGEYVLQKAAEQDKGIESLLDTKFVKEPVTAAYMTHRVLSRCCRGRV